MPAIGWESLPLLGSYKFPSSATTSSVITIPACELLQIQFNITGYTSSGGIASLKFNGDATAADYVSTYGILSSTTLTTTTTFGGFKLGQNSVTVQRSGLVTIYNFLGTAHPITSQSITQSTTAPVVSVGGGNWTSGSSAQITSVQMILDTANSITAGSSFAIFGMNPS